MILFFVGLSSKGRLKALGGILGHCHAKSMVATYGLQHQKIACLPIPLLTFLREAEEKL